MAGSVGRGDSPRAASMTSLERIKRAIHFGRPDRLPTSGDVFSVASTLNHAGHSPGGEETYTEREVTDDFGCTWRRTEVLNMGYVVGHPLQDWEALGSYRWPDPDDPAKYEGMEERFSGSEGKYVMTGLGLTLWERLWMLRGMEQALVELQTQRERMEALADRIVEYNLGVLRNLGQRFRGRLHGIGFTDDWGTQWATFISPRLWHEFFQPRYARIFQATHDLGWETWIHSDGRINEIVGGWIEAGLDVINMPAPRMVGIEEIGRRYRGRICFNGGCDNQSTLPFGSSEEIREEARLLLEHWATPEGGFIGPDLSMAEGRGGTALRQYGLSLAAVETMVEAFHEFDPYRHDD
jgi:uroporphyrinogen decarboxylase